MGETTHTPGPWRPAVALASDGRHVEQTVVVDETGQPVASAAWRNGWTPNVRLIAAAPDYHEHAYHLAMLVLQSNLYRDDPDVREQVDNVLAIHAKAEGRAK